MEELAALLAAHRWQRNQRRLNLGGEVRRYGKRPYLVRGHYSNVLKSGRILQIVQEMLPDASITEVCINRSVECPPHRDKTNTGPSFILFLGGEGGALVFEDGTRYEERGVWHGGFRGDLLTHWNEPITSGIKYSVVAYSRVHGREETAGSYKKDGDGVVACSAGDHAYT